MHDDKSQLLWKGKTLLEHSCQLLLDSGCNEVLVSCAQDETPRNIIIDYTVIADRFPQAGPLAGFESAMHHLLQLSQNSALLVVPVDMPLMSTELLKVLVSRATENAQSISKAVYFSAGRFPMILPVSVELRNILSEMLTMNHSKQNNEGRATSIRKFLDNVEPIIIDSVESGDKRFFNCNTPEDYQQLSSS